MRTLFIDTATKTVAYLRVSTTRQNVQGRRLAILEYARSRHSVLINEFVEATASAATSPKRRRLDDLMSTLESGDRLVVSELLSRLGRLLGQTVAMLDTLAREGIAFFAIKEQRSPASPDQPYIASPAPGVYSPVLSRHFHMNLTITPKGMIIANPTSRS